ncbi:MAG: hypothetical protein ACU826_07950 [Gammaproteobacteria bacterium]
MTFVPDADPANRIHSQRAFFADRIPASSRPITSILKRRRKQATAIGQPFPKTAGAYWAAVSAKAEKRCRRSIRRGNGKSYFSRPYAAKSEAD